MVKSPKELFAIHTFVSILPIISGNSEKRFVLQPQLYPRFQVKPFQQLKYDLFCRISLIFFVLYP